MIISASRRTDIPAFYTEWFMNRIREGYCLVPNPFNPDRVSRVSLIPADVEAIVFWTRNPAELLHNLSELDERGHRYYFLYTLLDYPSFLEPAVYPFRQRIDNFKRLSDRLGNERVIWRYDPIILSRLTDTAFHTAAFDRIASRLEGYTKHSIISILDVYNKVKKRLSSPLLRDFKLIQPEDDASGFEKLMRDLAQCSQSHGMSISSCAEKYNLKTFGIKPGRCIDSRLIERLFNVTVTHKKDPGQRVACRCAVSRDIGAYDTCLYGCLYCYATGTRKMVVENRRRMNPASPYLLKPPSGSACTSR